MSALRVWSGRRPSWYHSVRAISDSAESAGNHDLDTFCPETEGRFHGFLHGAPERDAADELTGNVFRQELRVELGALDLLDIDVDLAAQLFLEVVAQLVDLGALAADDDPRP